jgi:hypothetical protein
MTDELMNSEYNNIGELFGIGELENATHGMTPVKKALFIRKVAGQVHSSRRSRAEMEKFFKQVPKHVREELLKGGVRLIHHLLHQKDQLQNS